MDQAQYSSLLDALAQVPDPRQARGKQVEWPFVLGVIASALLSQQRSGRAIAQWAARHAAPLIAAFKPARRRVPSASTIRRALHKLDVVALERHIARIAPAVAPTPASPDRAPPRLRGYAIDGKHLRGAAAHGHAVHLVSLVCHHRGRVVAQTAVHQSRHESSAVGLLLAGRDLAGTIVTMDAGLTHPAIARQILQQRGHYFMVVKRNQHQLFEDLSLFFASPPLPCDPPWRTSETVSKGHGRLETRRVTCTVDDEGYLSWPGVRQLLRRDCERIILKSGAVSRTVTYALTSAPPDRASCTELALFWRRHWTIENRVHYVRDVTMGEDAHRMRTGAAPHALAALRNTLLNLLRLAGWTNIADALRHYNASARDAVRFIRTPIARL